jgi:hypothetical protein
VIISPVKIVEFATERMSCIILRGLVSYRSEQRIKLMM